MSAELNLYSLTRRFFIVYKKPDIGHDIEKFK